jgi:hypothetical protein
LPEVSTVNFPAGGTVPNQAIIPLDSRGQLCVTSIADADLVIDVNGVFRTLAPDRSTPLVPSRILDTRSGDGGSGRLGAGATFELQVRGRGGVPASATAVAMNLTAADPSDSGYVTAYPCGAVPYVSNLNTWPLHTRPNLVIVPLSERGTVCILTTVETDLLADVNGYFSASGTRQFVPLAPVRMLDTRDFDPRLNGGMSGYRLSPGQVLRLPLAGQRGIPAGSKALAVNVTVTGALAAGHLTAFPCGNLPVVSNVNFAAFEDVANAAQVTLDAEGGLCIWASAELHVIIDVTGAWN